MAVSESVLSKVSELWFGSYLVSETGGNLDTVTWGRGNVRRQHASEVIRYHDLLVSTPRELEYGIGIAMAMFVPISRWHAGISTCLHRITTDGNVMIGGSGIPRNDS